MKTNKVIGGSKHGLNFLTPINLASSGFFKNSRQHHSSKKTRRGSVQLNIRTMRLTTNNSSEHNSTATVSNTFFPPTFVYHQAVATCYILIVAVAALGNLIVCFAIIANKSLRSSPTNLFILSLVFSDLLTATLTVPFDIEGLFLNLTWKHGEIMCHPRPF